MPIMAFTAKAESQDSLVSNRISIKCGFGVLFPDNLYVPVTGTDIITDTHFTVICNETGQPTVSLEYAQWVLDAAITSWDIETAQFGDPPDNVIDIRIRTIGAYGVTYDIDPDSTIDTTYVWGAGDNLEIWIDPAVADTQPLVNVTVAHEFMHCIQAAYDWHTDISTRWTSDPDSYAWIDEGTAVWAEDLVYDSVDDYINSYINSAFSFLANPDTTIYDFDYRYESVLYWKFLSEHYGDYSIGGSNIIGAVLEETRNGVGGIYAVENALHTIWNRYSFPSTWLNFTVANYLNDDWYSEGNLYNMPQSTTETFDGTEKIISVDVDCYATDYVRITSSKPTLMMAFNGDDNSLEYAVKAILIHGTTFDTLYPEGLDFTLDSNKDGSLTLMNADQYSNIVVIVTRLDTSSDSGDYSIRLLPIDYDLSVTTNPETCNIGATVSATLTVTKTSAGSSTVRGVVNINDPNHWTEYDSHGLGGVASDFGLTGDFDAEKTISQGATATWTFEFVVPSGGPSLNKKYEILPGGTKYETPWSIIGGIWNLPFSQQVIHIDNWVKAFDVQGQPPQPEVPATTFSVTCSVDKDTYSIGEEVIGTVVVENTGSQSGEVMVALNMRDPGDWVEYDSHGLSGMVTSTPDNELWVSKIIPAGESRSWSFKYKIPHGRTSVGNWDIIGGVWDKTFTVPLVATPWSVGFLVSPANVDVVLVIDRSGSMLGSKIRDARIAAKEFVDLMQTGDKIGVVSYSSYSRVDFQLSEITSSSTKDAAKNGINQISASGSTAMGRGLRSAYGQLVNYGDSSHPWSIVLMSNGWHNTGEHPYNVIPDLKSKDIRVYTIGLGSGADGALLGYIASQTEGFYRFAPTSEDLLEIYNDLAAAITQTQTISSASGSVGQGETSQQTIDIDSTVSQATFAVSWGGSDLDLTLHRPDSEVIDPSVAELDPDIEYIEEVRYEIYRIQKPMAGTWTMVITGVNVPGVELYVSKVTAFSSITLALSTEKDSYVYPEPVGIFAQLLDTGRPLTGATMRTIVTRPDGTTITLVLFDDGEPSHGDTIPGDAVYSNYFSQFDEDGAYNIKVVASGMSFIGESFRREDQKTVLVSGVPTDTTPPTTTLLIDYPQYTDTLGNIHITSDTPITLTAVDNNGAGSGLADTKYRIYNSTYDTGWTVSVPPITFYIISLDDGSYDIDYYSIDNAENVEETNTETFILDNSGPSITMLNPPAGWALQDGVTFIASAVDPCRVVSLNFSIRDANDGEGVPVGFEDLPASYNAGTGEWSLSFDTLLLPDGYYVVLVEALDNLGNIGSIPVPYSIRNWAVLELLPASKDNKAGRTMPVKFSLRVAALVDPLQPFVYNEELTIEIYAKNNPDEILQESTFGDTASDYRISSVHYITNFQTLKKPMEYTVTVYRHTLDIDSFTFQTVKCTRAHR